MVSLVNSTKRIRKNLPILHNLFQKDNKKTHKKTE